MKAKFLILVFSVLGFCTCKNQPIFYAISQEVKLKKFSVQGTIVGIGLSGDKLYAANPQNVFTKNKTSSDKWDEVSGTPGTIIQKITANDSGVFVSFLNGGAYFLNGGGWKKIEKGDSIQSVFGSKKIFGSDDNTIFYLTDSSASEIKCKDANDKDINPAVNYYLSGAAGDYFGIGSSIYKYDESSKTAKAVDNQGGGLNDTVISMCEDSSGNVFVLAGNSIYCFNPLSQQWSSKSISCKTFALSALSYFELKPIKTGEKIKKSILIGGKEGYSELLLDSDTPDVLSKASEISPGSEKSTTPPQVFMQYDSEIRKYQLSPVFAVDHENGNYAVFAAVSAGQKTTHTGLWSFYSSGRVEWNRE